jgi:hypothetical protein
MVIETRDDGQVYVNDRYFGWAGFTVDNDRVRHLAFSPDALIQPGVNPSVGIYIPVEHWEEVIGQLWMLAQMARAGEAALAGRAAADLLPVVPS